MKPIIIIFFATGLFLTLACDKLPIGNDFLDKAPGVDVTADTVFSNLEYAERFLWGAYRTLRFGLNVDDKGGKDDIMRRDFLESITDLCHSYLFDGGAVRNYYTGGYTSSENAMSKYSLLQEDSWDGIRRSYLFIQNIDRVPDVDPAYRKQLKAEALMIIALHYSDMYRNLGGMPWVGRAYAANEPVGDLRRLTAQATCDSIVALCDRAAIDLPWTIANPEEWDGRFTKAAAMGAKARILLFNASPLYNSTTPFLDGEASSQKLTWHGAYDHNLWKDAMDAASDLISQAEATGDYKIYHKAGNTYRQDFQDAYYTRGNGEMLISTRTRFRSPSAPSFSQNYIFYYSATWGCGLGTQELVDFFPMASGLPITDAASGYNPNDPYINRDPRLYETVLTNGDSYQGRTAELWIGGRERKTAAATVARTGYPMRKFVLDQNSSTSYGSIVHWPYLRLAEIYLSYAEASNEFNNGPDIEAYRCVNIVRNRVGLSDLPSDLTREQFREAVLTERICEFTWEEVRWYDLIRWRREDDFKKRLHGCDIKRSPTPPYTYTYTIWEIPARYWMTNWSPKWYLSAFTASEILLGYGLVQNPGWE